MSGLHLCGAQNYVASGEDGAFALVGDLESATVLLSRPPDLWPPSASSLARMVRS